MEKQTELESKVAKILSKALEEPIKHEPVLKNALSSVALSLHTFSDDLPKVVVVSMPLELLIHAKLQSKSLVNTLKKEFPKCMVVMRRTGEIPAAKKSSPIRIREQMIADLLFPATVAARVNEVQSREDMTQVVYVDSRDQFWTKPELSAIEKLLHVSFGQCFRVRVFGAGV